MGGSSVPQVVYSSPCALAPCNKPEIVLEYIELPVRSFTKKTAVMKYEAAKKAENEDSDLC